MDRLKILSLLGLLILIGLTGCAPRSEETNALLPAGRGYAEGKEIYFVHTEASEAEIAQMLTDMMDSPVLHVPALADIPESALARVYVFTNGIKGKGPLGFASDVFDNPPGTPGYSPLRRIVLVTWTDAARARELKSAQEILNAAASGEVTLEPTGMVVNMPFITWDGGKR